MCVCIYIYIYIGGSVCGQTATLSVFRGPADCSHCSCDHKLLEHLR